MGDFLSLLGSMFDSFFGFIYFAVAYYVMHKGELFKGAFRSVQTIVHVIIMLVGLFLLGPGLYAAVEVSIPFLLFSVFQRYLLILLPTGV